MLRDSQTGLYHEEYFNEFLSLEKKRCERSKAPVFLMRADLSAFADPSERQKIAKSIMKVLSGATRDTDVKGWHVDGVVIGIMFTETTGKETTSTLASRHIANEWLGRLRPYLGKERSSRIQISWQAFPEEFPKPRADEGPGQKTVPPPVIKKTRIGLVTKRLTDVIGSVISLL
jgi:hypothetical protein